MSLKPATRLNLGKPRGDDALLVGPAACMRSRRTGRACDACRTVPAVLHVPIRQRGQFCPSCCPCCNAGQRTAAA